MILRLFRPQPSDAARLLYDQIVAQARSPGFYRDYRVPDTFDGRFEVVVLHLFLLLHRLKLVGDGDRALGQQVFDCFCQDMDENLREIGVSDLKVPKEMRRVGEAYYGRAGVYEAALRDAKMLPAILTRNVLAGSDLGRAAPLAHYVLRAVERLELQNIQDFRQGAISFPAV